MKNAVLLTIVSFLVFGCTSGDDAPGNFQKAPAKIIPELNKVREVQLETRASNESDESNYYKSVLYLTDYDKKYNQAVAVIDGHFDSTGSKNFVPYVNEVCFSFGACGVVFTDLASLEDITMEQASMVMNRDGLKVANNFDKSLFKNGAILLIHSETPEIEKGPVWVITLAIEMTDFKRNAKNVKLKYKVLQYKMKK